MKQKIYSILLLFIITQISGCNAQTSNNKLKKAKESISKYKFDLPFINKESGLNPIGYYNESIIYSYESDKEKSLQFYRLNEENFTFQPIFPEMKVDQKNSMFYSIKDSLLFYTNYILSKKNYGYNVLILQKGNKKILLDSIYNADKIIHASFSTDGKILFVNSLNTLLDFYNPEQDDRIACYFLESVKDSQITKKYLPCLHCSDTYLIGNKLFFNKSTVRDDLSNGFEWKDIYMATWPELRDTIKIASFSKIVSISQDGKYILAIRQFDLPNNPYSIIEVSSRKYQLLLGREYEKSDAIFSIQKGRFAFDFHDGRIIYVEKPSEFPYDALLKGNPEIPFSLDTDIYKQSDQ